MDVKDYVNMMRVALKIDDLWGISDENLGKLVEELKGELVY